MIDPIRVLVPIDSNNETAFKTALAYADAICEQAGPNVRDVVLLVHGKGQLNNTRLSHFLGAANVKALSSGPVGLPGNRRLTLQTLTKRPFLTQPAVVIAYYADMKLLDTADGLHNLAGVVAVPWVPGELDSWVARWSAQVHGAPPQPATVLINDPTVVRALQHLTAVINLSTGLSNRSDKANADETLRILRAKGHADPTPVIKSWAVREGWKPDHATALETLARRIWGLKGKPALSGIQHASERYSRWSETS